MGSPPVAGPSEPCCRSEVDAEGALSAKELAMVAEGRAILAIKTYRTRTGAGLREAKEVVARARA